MFDSWHPAAHTELASVIASTAVSIMALCFLRRRSFRKMQLRSKEKRAITTDGIFAHAAARPSTHEARTKWKSTWDLWTALTNCSQPMSSGPFAANPGCRRSRLRKAMSAIAITPRFALKNEAEERGAGALALTHRATNHTEGQRMFNHIMVGSNDIERSKRFYDAVLGVLGAGEPARNTAASGHRRLFYRHNGNTFCVSEPINSETATFANGGTIAFKCSSPEQVKQFHDIAIANGGNSIEDPPGLRESSSLGAMHLSYVRDPDGNKLCAIYRVK
jgi:catechol 2,3-dioxygenase-like lactoylglutathione lyase family enzyme